MEEAKEQAKQYLIPCYPFGLKAKLPITQKKYTKSPRKQHSQLLSESSLTSEKKKSFWSDNKDQWKHLKSNPNGKFPNGQKMKILKLAEQLSTVEKCYQLMLEELPKDKKTMLAVHVI